MQEVYIFVGVVYDAEGLSAFVVPYGPMSERTSASLPLVPLLHPSLTQGRRPLLLPLSSIDSSDIEPPTRIPPAIT